MNYIDKFNLFMKGRYGVNDDFNKFILKSVFILIIINLFIKSLIITLICILLIIIYYYRLLSHKIYVRSNENRLFLNIKYKFISKDYIYKKCHKCHKKLRFKIPNKIGMKTNICPNCKHKNKYLILRFK